MSQAFLEAQEHIIEKLETLAEAAQFDTYDGAIPTGASLRKTGERYWPYVVYGFGGKSDVARRQQGITSSRDDLKQTAVVFYCVGDSPRTVRRLKNLIRDEFEGYVISDTWGQLTEKLSGDYGISKPDPDLIPLRFGESLVFGTMTGD